MFLSQIIPRTDGKTVISILLDSTNVILTYLCLDLAFKYQLVPQCPIVGDANVPFPFWGRAVVAVP